MLPLAKMIVNQWFKQELEAAKPGIIEQCQRLSKCHHGHFSWGEGVWETERKGYADSAGEEEQLVNLQVEMFHLLKAYGKAEWHLGHWFKKEQALVLEPSNVDVESMEKALG